MSTTTPASESEKSTTTTTTTSIFLNEKDLWYDVKSLDPPQSGGEKFRDLLLAALDGPIFQVLGAANMLLIVGDGAFFFFLMIGAQTLCSEPSRTNCEPRNSLVNLGIQILCGCFTYMAVISMPWRCINLIQLSGGACPRRAYQDGKDLYGQDTDDIWFHIPRKTRIIIMLQLLFNCLFQFANQATRIVYSDYASSNEMPGAFWVNIFFVLAMLTSLTGGVQIAMEESKLRKEHPGKFGPGPIEITKAYLCKKKKKEDDVEKQDLVEGEEPQKTESTDEQEPKIRRNTARWEANHQVLNYNRSSMRMFGM